MVIAGGTAYLVQRERTLSGVDARLSSAVADARFVTSDAGATTLDAALTALVQRIRPSTGESTFAIGQGATALVPGGDTSFAVEQDAAFVSRMRDETARLGVVRGTATTSVRAVRYVAIPVSVSGGQAGGVFVLAVDLDAALRPLNDAFRTFALLALGSLVMLGLIGWFVAGRLLRPIRQLRETAARITATGVSERIPVTGTDDVSELTSTVNGMLDRLEGALTGQRQLLDDVGHELKTPITIVRGHLELMEPANAADVGATKTLAIDELDRMSGLVHDISELAQLQRPLHVRVEPTDIDALVERVRVKASALSTAHSWMVGERAGAIAEVDPDRITQALLQLAANAVTHGECTEITFGGSASGRGIRLWVHDDGRGIDEKLLPLLFERFRRGTAGRGEAGSGLGLAIVAAIAEAHGGRATATSTPGAGATFTIDLPGGAA
jgi:signal transduction histidine kinase